MGRNYIKGTSFAAVAAACLAGSMASAGSIRFDDVSLFANGLLQPGIIGYDQDAGILYGIGIRFSDVQGFGGTLDDPTPYSCVACFLDFAVQATAGVDFAFTIPPGPVPDSIAMNGEVAGITLPPVASVPLITGGNWTSASGGQDTQGFDFTGRGFDFKNDELVTHYFGAPAIGTEFAFRLQLQTPNPRIIGAPTGFPTIDYYWDIEDAQLINTPRVPEPVTTSLFALGLALIALRRRHS